MLPQPASARASTPAGGAVGSPPSLHVSAPRARAVCAGSRGEVWIDARASSGGAKRVAPSFDAWYRGWLDDAVANTGPWVPWDSERCASPHAFAQMLEHLNRGAAEPKTGKGSLEGNVPRGGLKIMSSGGEYFPPNAIVDPCHGCVALADHLGVPQDAFAPGSRPFEGASPPPPKSASPGGLGRWLRRVTGG